MAAEDYSNLSVQQKISALVRGIEGDERWNAALAKAPNAEAMLDLLESAANKLAWPSRKDPAAHRRCAKLWFKRNKPC